MNEDDLHGLVQFLSESTQTDIEVVGNETFENGGVGTHFVVSLFVTVADAGDSWLPRSKIGPTAVISTEKHEFVSGTHIYDQKLSSIVSGGFATIYLYCHNTRFVIVEDVEGDGG
jgi:hypothetical protein